MGMIERVRALLGGERSVIPALRAPADNWLPWVTMDGVTYGLADLAMTSPGERQEPIEANFASFTQRGLKSNGIIFSLIRDRVALFSQARFQWRGLRDGRLFGNASLSILERPWPNATTADLLARAEMDVSLAGNFYATERNLQIKRMRPDWVDMLMGSYSDPDMTGDDLDAEFLGIFYYPGGRYSGQRPVYLRREEIAHYAPIPDPTAHVRGMSWMSPVVREIMADDAATTHKLKFFENGATPNLVVKRQDAPGKEQFREWRELIEEGHRGVANAYRTLYLTNGADATVVGKDLQQLDFKVVQGGGETRLAAASGIHPVVAGLSEGMQGASLNAGNFASARRLTADKTLWWLWTNFAGSMEALIAPPAGAQLWVDVTDIPFLREDRKDAAAIVKEKMLSIESGVRAGFKPDSIVAAVETEDLTQLVHTGLYSVQLQPPGTTTPEPSGSAVEV